MTDMGTLFEILNRTLFYGRLPREYRVELVPRASRVLDFGKAIGVCQWALRRIRIADHLAPDEQRKTLLHEMCHAATEGRGETEPFHREAWKAEMWRIAQLGERWAEAEAVKYYGAEFGCLAAGAAVEIRSSPAKPLDRLTVLTRLEETRSLCRRALRAQSERFLAESRALREAAELRLDAPLTAMGQFLGAARRGRW